MEEEPAGNIPGGTEQQPVISPSSPDMQSGIEPARNKVCSRCGTVNHPSSVYCYRCGMKLTDTIVQSKKICTGCNAPNAPTSGYCYKCGLKLPDKIGTGELTGKHAGFWIRLLAYIIDGVLLGIVTSFITVPIFLNIFGSTPDFSWLSMIEFPEKLESSFWLYYWLTVLISLGVETVYYTIAIGKWGRTIGKAILKLKVLKSDGSHVSYGRAFGRSWAYVLNGFTLGIGFLVIAFNAQKRGLHDFICDTIVVKTD
ncbi:MAG: RDD family protein [Dehalococcoidales bacterium]|nr:RDD family protein [Dehalococcoidales bacterium]